MNNGQGGFSFDSGQITMRDVLNTNDKRVVGSAGGGFEIEEGRLKMLGDIDLNGHGLHETLVVDSDKIKLSKNLDLNGHSIADVLNTADRIHFHRDVDFRNHGVYMHDLVV